MVINHLLAGMILQVGILSVPQLLTTGSSPGIPSSKKGSIKTSLSPRALDAPHSTCFGVLYEVPLGSSLAKTVMIVTNYKLSYKL